MRRSPSARLLIYSIFIIYHQSVFLLDRKCVIDLVIAEIFLNEVPAIASEIAPSIFELEGVMTSLNRHHRFGENGD